MTGLRTLDRARNISDLRDIARCRVPRFSFEYVDGGAEDEQTLRANRSSFARVGILPKQLAGIEAVDMSANLLGSASRLPIAIAPTGYNGLLARNGDLALAETAKAAGIPFTQSTMSSNSIEEVARVLAGGRHWFQLYMLKDRTLNERLVERALEAGCEALVLTTDAIVLGNREGDKHNFSSPGRLAWRSKLNVVSRLPWMLDVLWPKGPPGFGNLAEFLPTEQSGAIDGARFISSRMNAALGWRDVDWLRSAWPRKLLIKGILRPEDASLAADHGADAVVVSNHGGRQLDGAASPLFFLPRIRDALRGRCELLMDSGIRRGSDMFKAISLGASGVFIGRAILYGLAAGGKAGAARSVAILKSELERTMTLAGCSSIAQLNEDMLYLDQAQASTACNVPS